MTEAPSRALARIALLQGLKACDARVYRFIAGAGFGKSTLAAALARSRGQVSLCDLLGARTEIDAWRRLITALSKLAGAEGEGIATESLTLALSDRTERDSYLRGVAQRAALHGALLVENAEHLADGGLLSPLRSLLSGRPSCTMIVCSRTDLALELAKNYAPHEFITVRERDLRFDASDFRRLLDGTASSEMLERALTWSAGWPLAAARAIALLRGGNDLPKTPSSETWLRDLVAETVTTLAPEFREALLRLAAIPEPLADEILVSVAQEQRERARKRLLISIPFLAERADGSLELHALAREELLRAFTRECAQAREAVFAEATARGDHLRCAELALQFDDIEAAADALGRVDHDFYQMPPARYVTVLERLDTGFLLQRPTLWMVSEICLKSDFLALNGELEPVLRAKASTLAPRTRMACAALVCFRKGEYDGRWEDGLALLDEFEREYSDGCVRPRDFVYAAMYRCGAASNAALPFDGAAYWRDYGEELAAAPIFYGESLYWEVARAYFRGETAQALAAIDRYIDHVRKCGYPIYRRASLYRSLFFCWELDPRGAYERYRRELVALLTDASAPNDLVAQLSWEMLNATRGVSPYRDGPIVSTSCLMNLILAAESDDFDLVEAAMNQALEMIGSPALRSVNIKIGVAAFAFDPAAHEHLLDRAFAAFDGSAAAELRRCVQELRAGRNGGILELLATRFRAAGHRFRNGIFIDVTLGRIRRAGAEIHLGDREMELLMLLAGTGRPLPALEIAEMLWPDSDDAAARNALKVCISRIRARTGCKELIVTTGGDVALSEAYAQIDLDRAERLLLLAQEGSVAAAHAAREILTRPIPERFSAWHARDAVTMRWKSLAHRP